MLPTIDRSAAPLLVVRFPPEFNSGELARHLDEMVQVIGESPQPRVAVVVDLVDSNLFSPALRENAMRLLHAAYPKLDGRIVGVAHVVGSAFSFGAMSSVLWLIPAPHPTLVTRSTAEGIAWATRRLDAQRPPIAGAAARRPA